MMKCLFALVILSHLCYSVESDMNLNVEMINRLEKLHKLYRDNKLNITSPDAVRIPSKSMNSHASSCVGVFVMEVNHLLNNVTVHKDNQHILQELKANLQAKGAHRKIASNCGMVNSSLSPFKQFSNFLKKLNSKGR